MLYRGDGRAEPGAKPCLRRSSCLLSFIYATYRRLEITIDVKGVTQSYRGIRRRVPFRDISSVELPKITPSKYSRLGLRYSTLGDETFSDRFGDAVRRNRKNKEPLAFTPENPRRTLDIIKEFKSNQRKYDARLLVLVKIGSRLFFGAYSYCLYLNFKLWASQFCSHA